jgi:hypothetical protein
VRRPRCAAGYPAVLVDANGEAQDGRAYSGLACGCSSLLNA